MSADPKPHPLCVTKGRPVLLAAEGDTVLMKYEGGKVIVGGKKWGKVDGTGLQGTAYTSVFEVREGGALAAVAPRSEEVQSILGGGSERSSVDDNRALVDNNSSQSLTTEEIKAMKEKGASVVEVVGSLVKSSATFEAKTKFAQEKYVRRKAKKHSATIVSLLPCGETIARHAFDRGNAKHDSIRPDTLALALHKACLDGSCAVFDTANGAITAAVAERLGSAGRVLAVLPSSRNVMKALPYCAQFIARPMAAIQQVSLQALSPGDAVAWAPCRSLVALCARYRAVDLVRALWPTLEIGGMFVLVCEALSQLEEISEYLGGSLVCDLEVCDLWTREYQVLQDRTHPVTDMNGAAGYLFSAVKVEPDEKDLARAKDAWDRLRPAVRVPAPAVTPAGDDEAPQDIEGPGAKKPKEEPSQDNWDVSAVKETEPPTADV